MAGTASWLRDRGRPARRALGLTVALGELSGILLLLQTALLVRIGDGVIFRGSGPAELAPAFGWLLGVIFTRALLTWGSRRAAFSCASAVKTALRAELVGHLRLIGPVALAGMRAGEIATTAVDAVEALDGYFSKYLPQRAVATLLPFTILAVVFPLDWISGLVLVLTAVFLPASMIVIGQEAHERNQRLWGKLSRMSGRFLDILRGLTTVRMFGAARREAEEIATSSEEYRVATMSVIRIAFVSSLMLELISTVSIAIVAVICGLRLLHGTMGFAPGYFILLIAPEYFLTLRTLGTYYHSRMEAASAAEHIRALLDVPAADRASGGVQRGSRPPAISFRDVVFTYSGRPVLEGASFTLAAGEHVALIGTSGVGKSTILALLLGFAAPQSGAITVDGVPLSGLDRSEWLSGISWLPQRPTLFHGTIRENIRLGRLDAGEEEIRDAARLARMDEFLGRLPHGLDTAVGERGEGLSGGQAQRVALARLFLRSPGLVLLDEPTAHLDAESAALVEEGIGTLARGRTLIVVTHRQGTAAAAGRTLVVEGGRVREAG